MVSFVDVKFAHLPANINVLRIWIVPWTNCTVESENDIIDDPSSNVAVSNEDAADLLSDDDTATPNILFSEQQKRLQPKAAESEILKQIIEKQVWYSN